MPEQNQNNNNENKEKDKRSLTGEWLLLLLSIILLILLLFIFGKIGISYYKLQKNSVFRIYDNVVILGPGEASDELRALIEEIESLPSIESIRDITDLDTLYELIDKIYSILQRAKELPDEERYYFNQVYRQPLEELLDALWDRVYELGGGRSSEDEYQDGRRRVGPGGEEVPGPQEEKRKEREPGGGGGSHPSGPTGQASSLIVRDKEGETGTEWYEYRLDEEGNVTYWKVDVNTDGTKTETEMFVAEGGSIPTGFDFKLFNEAIDGVIYPGDKVSKKYEAEITYTGRVGLRIEIPKGAIQEEKDSIASKLKCEAHKLDNDGNRVWSSGAASFEGMNKTCPLDTVSSETTVKVPIEIVVSVPTDFNDDYTLKADGTKQDADSRYQGKKITDFTVKWSINNRVY